MRSHRPPDPHAPLRYTGWPARAIARRWRFLAVVSCTAGALAAASLLGLPRDDRSSVEYDAGLRSGSDPASPATRISLQQPRQAEYDGRFTFTRIRYGSGLGRRGWRNAWAHDYPSADLNMGRILREFTTMRPTLERTNVLDLEDPTIFEFPVLYMAEPGFWSITEEGARNLRQHLLKGGLIIFDDFEADQWYNFAAQLQRALPEYDFIEIGPDHPVFQSFYYVEDIYVPHPLVPVTPKYFAMFEDNDPTKRMLALVNYNADLAEYWEWSGQGFFPVDPTTEAYKLGVNYIIYAVTH